VPKTCNSSTIQFSRILAVKPVAWPPGPARIFGTLKGCWAVQQLFQKTSCTGAAQMVDYSTLASCVSGFPKRLDFGMWVQWRQHVLTSESPLCRVSTMTPNEPRLTAQTLKVLGILLSHPKGELSGAEISRATKLPSGTLYPILLRLEYARWADSHWETEDPRKLGRPRRRLYQITGLGAKRAKSAFREITSTIEAVAWR
jgi:PadR family transcriptional regulator, regulatory protein PadR